MRSGGGPDLPQEVLLGVDMPLMKHIARLLRKSEQQELLEVLPLITLKPIHYKPLQHQRWQKGCWISFHYMEHHEKF